MIIKYFLFIIFLGIFSCTETPKDSTKVDGKKITWSQQIAPIIYKNCTPCHRPGESGPFNLVSYADAVKKARLIKFVTQTGYMPPWPADPSYSHFLDEKVLSVNEIAQIKSWVDNGCARGDSAQAPKPPVFYKGSYFGKPDLVIRPQKPVAVKGNGTDVFLIMKYPYEIEHDTLIDFVEFVPQHRKVIHHVNGNLISYDDKRPTNHMYGESVSSDSRENVVDIYKSMNIPYADKLQPQFPLLTLNTVYYLPGYIPPAYPESIGGLRFRKKGAFLLNNIHYGPSSADLIDSSYINVFYRRSAIQRPVRESQLGTFGASDIEPEFVIPANEIKTFHTQLALNQDISLLSVNPHMHLIGKTFWAFALRANADTIPLIRIKKWDFRWQYYYTFKHPLKLEAGTVIHVYGTYDNTSQNPNNPNRPPRVVTQGNGVESMKTSEEMFQFIFTYLPYQKGDEKIDLER